MSAIRAGFQRPAGGTPGRIQGDPNTAAGRIRRRFFPYATGAEPVTPAGGNSKSFKRALPSVLKSIKTVSSADHESVKTSFSADQESIKTFFSADQESIKTFFSADRETIKTFSIVDKKPVKGLSSADQERLNFREEVYNDVQDYLEKFAETVFVEEKDIGKTAILFEELYEEEFFPEGFRLKFEKKGFVNKNQEKINSYKEQIRQDIFGEEMNIDGKAKIVGGIKGKFEHLFKNYSGSRIANRKAVGDVKEGAELTGQRERNQLFLILWLLGPRKVKRLREKKWEGAVERLREARGKIQWSDVKSFLRENGISKEAKTKELKEKLSDLNFRSKLLDIIVGPPLDANEKVQKKELIFKRLDARKEIGDDRKAKNNYGARPKNDEELARLHRGPIRRLLDAVIGNRRPFRGRFERG